MTYVIAMGWGVLVGCLITAAFGAKVKAFIFKLLDKSVAKIEGK